MTGSTPTTAAAPNERERLIIPVGPDSGPSPPFPLRVRGPVIKGFGRGSKELNIPTANIPIEGLSVGGCETVESGIYYGWASLDWDSLPKSTSSDNGIVDGNVETAESELLESVVVKSVGKGDRKAYIFPMVMSIGWNPFYKNTVRSVEVHIIHKFPKDFYGIQMNLVILGYIRPEFDYISKEALIRDIKIDIEIAKVSLERDGYRAYMDDEYFLQFS